MTTTTLILEVADRQLPGVDTFHKGRAQIMITPPLDEDYWYWRVRLGANGQAIVGFPKFTTIGIGFAQEEDWNTNLPFSCSAEVIYQHIKHNKKDGAISKQKCLEAIEMIREAARVFQGLSDEQWAAEQSRMADARSGISTLDSTIAP